MGGALERALADLGVRWSLGRVVQSLDDEDGAVRVTLSDGTRFSTDGVLSAVGLRPRTALAAAAELRIGRGIVVDRRLETGVPEIYALGDCAEVEESGVALRHAHHARRTGAGEDARGPAGACRLPGLPGDAHPPHITPAARGSPWEKDFEPRQGTDLSESPPEFEFDQRVSWCLPSCSCRSPHLDSRRRTRV